MFNSFSGPLVPLAPCACWPRLQLRRIRTPQIPISPYAERLIGTIRRDCLDHVLIFGERHLRRALTLYSRYYNETRTHLG